MQTIQLTKSDREISTTEGNFLLPLRHSRHERHNKLTATSRPDPYRFDNDFLDDVLTNDAIHYPEHQARYRREVSTNEKTHVAYVNYKQVAELAKERLKMTGAVAEKLARDKAAALQEGTGDTREEGDSTDDSDNSDEGGAAKRKKKKPGKDKDDTEEIIDDFETPDPSTTPTPIFKVAVKMSMNDANQFVAGTMIEHFKTKVLDVSKLRILSPFDQKKYWKDLQDRALDHLTEIIQSKNVEMCSAALTCLGGIGMEKKKKVVKIELSKEKEALLQKYSIDPKKEAPKTSKTLLFERLGPLLAINQFNKEGLTPLHVAAGVGSVAIMELLVDAWDAELDLKIWDYSVYQHALNSVSKGISDEKALDWLQIRGANRALNVESRIGRYTEEFVKDKQAKDKAIEDEKVELKKAKARAKKKSRRKKATT